MNPFTRSLVRFNSSPATTKNMVPSTKQKDQLLKRVLHIRQVSRVNSGGKIRSTSALVIVGNQNGSAGMGMGRGKDTLSAVTKVSSHLTKATDQAEKNMISFPRLDNRTFFSDVDFKVFHKDLKEVPQCYLETTKCSTWAWINLQ